MEYPEISFRASVTREMRDLLPGMTLDSILWMSGHYPDVDFSNITWEATGGNVKSRYFHKEKRVLVCHHGYLAFYRRACREIRGLRERVGTYHPSLVTPSHIIHELTHHVQYERGFHKGNETDTSLNELCWMREYQPTIFHRCFYGKPPETGPAIIRPKRQKTSPAYGHDNNRGLRAHNPAQNHMICGFDARKTVHPIKTQHFP